jgi:hypothetical protein
VDQPHAGVDRALASHLLGGPIDAAVVDHHDLVRDLLLREPFPESVERRADVASLVAGGDHDGELHLLDRHDPGLST